MAKRNRKVRIFESAIERVARILSRKWKINVIFQHDRCETSGSTIYLPVLPDNASKELMDAMQGHLDHEASHVVNTDFKCLAKVVNFPKTMTVLNALEDPRIEALWVDMYPGAKLNLRRSEEFTLRKVAEEREMEDPEDGVKKMMKPWDSLSDLGKFLHASITYATQKFDDSHWFLQEVVEPAILDDVKKHSGFWQTAMDAKTTGELIPLARELLEKLGEDDPEQENQELDPEDMDANQAGQQGQGQPGGSAQSSVMHKGGGGKGGTRQVQEEGMSAEDNQNGNDYKPNYGNASDEDMEKDQQLMDRGEKLRDAAGEALIDEDRYLVYTTEGDEIERIEDGDRIAYKKFMMDAIKLVAPMKRKMARSMLATNQSRWENDKTRGKINRRRLHQVMQGTSKRVFRQRVQSEDYDTCVLMMIDHSGSMYGHSLDLAAKTAIVLGELLNQLGIPFSVQGFSTGQSSVASQRHDAASAAEQSLYARWGNLWIGEYKGFEEPWTKAGPKMINMVRNDKINTYDGESLRYGAQVLLARPEKRKIFFWLNDGEPCPNWGDDSRAHEKYAKDCAKEVEKLVELFAIGIGTDAVKRFYSNCVQINQLEDLPKACLSELDALIRKGKTYHQRK